MVSPQMVGRGVRTLARRRTGRRITDQWMDEGDGDGARGAKDTRGRGMDPGICPESGWRRGLRYICNTPSAYAVSSVLHPPVESKVRASTLDALEQPFA